MKKSILLLGTIMLVGCRHNIDANHTYGPTLGFACATVSVYGVEASTFVGPDNRQGSGNTCEDAYQDWKAK